MTSFCRSWMISAQRFGSSCRPSARSSGAGAEDAAGGCACLRGHVRLVARPDLGRDRVDRVRRGHEQRAEIGAAPAQIGDQFGHADLAQEIAAHRIDPHAARRRHPDIAVLIAFHAVRQAGLEFRADAAGEDAGVGKRTVGGDVEDADQRLHGVVDVEPLFVRRKAEAVRLVEQGAVDQQLRRAAAGRHAIDALEAELARPLDAVDRHAAVPGVGEIDRAARMHADVVRAVEFLVLEVRGEHVAAAVGALADQRRGGVLADDQIEVGVIGHAVAFVRRALDLDDAARGVPATANVGGHVRKQQIVIDRMPDRPLGEGEAGAELADRRIGIDQGFEFGAQRGVGHGRSLRPAQAGNQLRLGSD